MIAAGQAIGPGNGESLRADPPSLATPLETGMTAFMAAAAAGVLIYCLWGLDRGFEITDEAYYLLLAIHPKAATLYISAQQWLSAPIWHITGSLAAFRLAGMALLAGSAMLLAQGAIATLGGEGGHAPRPGGRFCIHAGTIVCALLYASTINLSPCYNLLVSAAANTAAGLFMLAMKTGKGLRATALLALTGLALGCACVCKLSSGVATLALLLVWMSALQGVSAIFAKNALVVFAAMLVCIAGLISVWSSWTELTYAVSHGLNLFKMVQSETILSRIFRYATEFGAEAGQAAGTFWPAMLGAGLYLRTRRPAFAAICFAALALGLISGDSYLGGADRHAPQIRAALSIYALVLLVRVPAWVRVRRIVCLVAGLSLLPYAVAFGSGNSIFTQVIDSLAPWGAVAGLLSQAQGINRTDRLMALGLHTVLIAILSAQILTSGFRAPYHLAKPLIGQTHRVSIGVLGSVRVDRRTVEFIAALEAAAAVCNIKAGAPFLGLYNIPGVALVLGTVPPETPWLNNLAQAESIFELVPQAKLDKAVVAVNLQAGGSNPPLPRPIQMLDEKYHVCGEAVFPFANQTIRILAPK